MKGYMAGVYNRRLMYFDGISLGRCSSCSSDGLSGLGFVPPDPTTIALMFAQVKLTIGNAIAVIEDFLGIGQGRQEADLIVPTQNLVTAQVLAPISEAVQYLEDMNCSQLNEYLDVLNKSETEWLTFLHDPRWTDGRAASQAEATLAPYFGGLRKDLTDEIKARCIGIIGVPGGSNNTILYAGLGLGALLLLPRLMKRS